jgi:1,4-alpha-glucan branching enzyme
MFDVLSQAARELVLLQSSDWPFLLTTGQAPEYAKERFREHAERFDRLATSAESGLIDTNARRLAADLWERDNVFADIDYRDWASHAGATASEAARISTPASRVNGPGLSDAVRSGTDGSAVPPPPVPEWTSSGS